jgi:tetratricopeptide (TPR) repeat protein
MASHVRIVGNRRDDRLAATGDGPAIVARCHRRLRGPYTGVDSVLTAILPIAQRSWPDLVDQHRFELLYGIPELEQLIGPTPPTLAAQSSFEERTRYFGSSLIRVLSQGIVSFLLGYAHRAGPLRLVFDEVGEAEPTMQELLAILIRRADPAVLQVVVAGDAQPLTQELESVLQGRGLLVDAPATDVPVQPRGDEELVRAYVESDGTAEDAQIRAAYQHADPALRARLHDQRADALDPVAGWGTRIAAYTYHREHGSDPSGAGREALVAAYRYCVGVGFSASIIDLGLRGRALTDPDEHPRGFYEFTTHTAAALVSLGRLDEAMQLLFDLRQRFTDPKIQMTTSYSLAMMYTRFLRPRDHNTALQYQNNAIAIANLLPDPTDRLVFSVFQDNALALIEMHRGNLTRALDLVEAGMARLDERLTDDQWRLHRSQLVYNRARLLAALGRLDEAVVEFTTLVELDPHYTDYLSERATAYRKLGDVDAALADYDRAVQLAPPYPELYFNRGTARLAAGDTDGALADFGYVLEMEPDDLDSRLRRAELLMELGELDAAESDVDTGLALRPDEVTLLCLKGTISLERGAIDEAFGLFDAALEREPQYSAALVNRAVGHFQAGRPESAVDDLTAALHLDGRNPDILLNRGIAQHAAGRAALAIADFDQALTMPGADRPELLFQRGLCLIDAGQPDRASIDLRECQRLGEHEADIEALLGGLKLTT